MLIRDVMTREVVTTSADSPLPRVVDEMLRYGVTGLPVVTRDRRVVGVITEADVIAKIGFGSEPRTARRVMLDELLHGVRHRWASKAEGVVAGDVMSSPAVTVLADATVRRAAQVLLTNSLKRLPVVDHDGRLVGIVSQRDLLRMIHHSDASIVAAVERALADPLRSPERHGVEVAALNGVVTLSGWVERSADEAIVVAAARDVPGVVQVSADLTVRDPAHR